MNLISSTFEFLTYQQEGGQSFESFFTDLQKISQ